MDFAVGTITSPEECFGDFFWRVGFYLANSQYECATTGVTGHTQVYGLRKVVGKCGSECLTRQSHTVMKQRVNNYGIVDD